MAEFLKKYVFISATGFVIFVFVSCLLFLNWAKDNGNYFIEKHNGDESVLEGLEIRGVLHDRYSGAEFSIRDGKTGQRFMYYKSYYDYRKNMVYYRNSFMYGRMRTADVEYSIGMNSNYGEPPHGVYMINAVKYENNKSQYKRFPSGIKNSSPNGDSLFYGTRMRVMEELGDRLYFVIPTDEKTRGESGIYEISQFNSKAYYHKEVEGYRKLADIELDNGRVQVRGMYAVQDNLCVVLSEDNKLILKAFSLLKEEFSKPLELEWDTGRRVGEDLYQVEGYSHGDYLILYMHKYSGTKACVFNVSHDVTLISCIDVDMTSRGDNRDMIYRNNMLYIIRETIDFPNREETGFGAKYPWHHLDLFVYNNDGNIVFSGRVETDINDDQMWQALSRDYDVYRENRPYIYRQYGQIQLR